MIDGFTIAAQVLNFLILVWLMKRYLYQPILGAIDARETRIAAELSDADARQKNATQQVADFQKKSDAFDQERAALLTRATEDASAERTRLLDQARKAADTLATQRAEALTADADTLHDALTRRTCDGVFTIARKTLNDLAGTPLETLVAEVFSQRIRDLAGPARDKLGEALRDPDEAVRIRSAFDLPPDAQFLIQRAINETFAADVFLRFETRPDLIAGVELTARDQKLAWSIDDHLTSMENHVAEAVTHPRTPEAVAP